MKSIAQKGVLAALLISALVAHLTDKYWLTFIPIPPELGGGRTFTIDFKVLVIVFLVTFLLVKALWEVVLQRKEKEWQGMDMLFLSVLFIGLFVPMSKINKEEISKQENRTLAKWQPFLLPNHKINFDFGKNFNEWFNDRFRFRVDYMNICKSIQYELPKYFYEVNKSLLLNKSNNWMTNGYSLNEPKFDTTKICENINRIKNLCESNHIKLYILLAPTKFEIYSKKIVGMKLHYNPSITYKNLKDCIEKNTGIPTICAYDELKSLSDTAFAYFKTDHHWTDEGAYKGYRLLMNEIKKDFPDIYVNTENDFDYTFSNQVRVIPDYWYCGHTQHAMNLDEKKDLLDTKYKYFKNKNYSRMSEEVKKIKDGGTDYHYVYNTNAPKLFLYGNSFVLNLLQSIVYSFNETRCFYIYREQKSNDLKLHEEELKKFKPNVMVLCYNSENYLSTLYR